MTTSSSYKDGFDAYYDGPPIGANPYSPESGDERIDHCLWNDGWRAAQKECTAPVTSIDDIGDPQCPGLAELIVTHNLQISSFDKVTYVRCGHIELSTKSKDPGALKELVHQVIQEASK